MFDGITPGWHFTIDPVYYISGQLLSILALVVLIGLILVKIFNIKTEKFEGPLNIFNWLICVLSSFLAVSSLLVIVNTFYCGDGREEYSFLFQVFGPYCVLFMIIFNWVPLFLGLLFWRKKNRINVNLALLVAFTINMDLWMNGCLLFLG